MIKKLLFLTVLLPSLAFSQDKIVMTDGNVKEGNITSDNGKYVRYTDKNNQAVAIKKDYIREIKYQNANKRSQVSNQSPIIDGSSLGNNIISYNFFGIVYKNIGFSYERILGNGNLSLKLPVSFSMGKFDEYTNRGHVFQTGLDLNIYPLGQGDLRYYLGPSIRFGEMTDSDPDYVFENGQQVNVQEENIESSYIGFMFNNGVRWQPTNNFSLSSNAGIGIRGFENEKFNDGISEVFFYMEASVGYRF